MSPGATFERVYVALKDQLGSGRYRPGDHLEPAALSDELNSSITPVRDALHRLVGEGLVDAPRSDGFRTPGLTELGLRHLYAWNQWLLTGALTAHSWGLADAAEGWSDLPTIERTEILFRTIASRTHNEEHREAVARVNERLRSVRLVEGEVLGDAGREIDALERSLLLADRRAVRTALAAYHRRRVRIAPEIVAALHAR